MLMSLIELLIFEEVTFTVAFINVAEKSEQYFVIKLITVCD